MANRQKRRLEKIVDDEFRLNRKGARLKDERWASEDGTVVKYSLAYINPRLCGRDNGRVLGYDNDHGHHHRHFMGSITPLQTTDFESIARQFYKEFEELWGTDDQS